MSYNTAFSSVKSTMQSIDTLRPLVYIVSNYLEHRSVISLNRAISRHIFDSDASYDAYYAIIKFAASLDEHNMDIWPDDSARRHSNIVDVANWLMFLPNDCYRSYYLFRYYPEQTQCLISELGRAVIESQSSYPLYKEPSIEEESLSDTFRSDYVGYDSNRFPDYEMALLVMSNPDLIPLAAEALLPSGFTQSDVPLVVRDFIAIGPEVDFTSYLLGHYDDQLSSAHREPKVNAPKFKAYISEKQAFKLYFSYLFDNKLGLTASDMSVLMHSERDLVVYATKLAHTYCSGIKKIFSGSPCHSTIKDRLLAYTCDLSSQEDVTDFIFNALGYVPQGVSSLLNLGLTINDRISRFYSDYLDCRQSLPYAASVQFDSDDLPVGFACVSGMDIDRMYQEEIYHDISLFMFDNHFEDLSVSISTTLCDGYTDDISDMPPSMRID
jgi:hypothetical protein